MNQQHTETYNPNQDDANADLKHRRIRSFVLRQGRLTKGQARALETGLPDLVFRTTLNRSDLNAKLSVETIHQKNPGNRLRYG